MNLALVDKIANAVLYEGYMLYPYRPSSVKNRQRWTFGGIYPQAYSEGQTGANAWSTQAECLVVARSAQAEDTTLDVRVRFLHLLARNVGALAEPLPDLPQGAEPAFQIVDALEVGEQLFQTWQEAVEREVATLNLSLSDLLARPQQQAFSFPAGRAVEPLRAPGGAVATLS